MRARREQELKLVSDKYGELELDSDLNWFIIQRFPVQPGWNKGETKLLVLIPAGYPVTPPDNFYADADLRLAGGGQPGNTSLDQEVAGRRLALFSWHVECGDWQPHADPLRGHNLLTFVTSVEERLKEAS